MEYIEKKLNKMDNFELIVFNRYEVTVDFTTNKFKMVKKIKLYNNFSKFQKSHQKFNFIDR